MKKHRGKDTHWIVPLSQLSAWLSRDKKDLGVDCAELCSSRLKYVQVHVDSVRCDTLTTGIPGFTASVPTIFSWCHRFTDTSFARTTGGQTQIQSTGLPNSFFLIMAYQALFQLPNSWVVQSIMMHCNPWVMMPIMMLWNPWVVRTVMMPQELQSC